MHCLWWIDSGHCLLLFHDDSHPIYGLGYAATPGIHTQIVKDTVAEISVDKTDRSKLSMTNTTVGVYESSDAGCLSLRRTKKMRAVQEAAHISNQQQHFSVAALFRFDGTDLRNIDDSVYAGKTFRAAFVSSSSDYTLQQIMKQVAPKWGLHYPEARLSAPSAMSKYPSTPFMRTVYSKPPSLFPNRFAGSIASFTACKTSVGLDAHWVSIKGAPLHWDSQAIQNCKVQSVLCNQTPNVDQEACEGYFVGRFLSVNKGRTHQARLSILYSFMLAMFSLASFFGAANGAPTSRKLGNTYRRFTSRTNKASIGFVRRAQTETSSTWSTSSSIFLLLTWTALLLLLHGNEATDLRSNIIDGAEPCFRYTPKQNLFSMNCSLLHWQTQGYGSDTYLSLRENETFDGDSGMDDGESTIDLGGIVGFKGLFTVDDTVTRFADAPLIRNAHVRKGTLAEYGGFIVRPHQKYFILDSCSSTGEIANPKGGGICGAFSGRDSGEIQISNSYSTGKIRGSSTGGIAGYQVGWDGGIVHISRCYSTGIIEGQWAGGIAGDDAGRNHARVYITRSYSTGEIASREGGGIVGDTAAWDSGYVYIDQCYSTGHISADYSGGIAGDDVADNNGEVHIADCYTRGDISGTHSGGITGLSTGGWGGASVPKFGDVYISNSYASGSIMKGGGIIGAIAPNFNGHTIHVQYSVHNGWPTVGSDYGNHLIQTGNSAFLGNIQGVLYPQWDSKIWYACAAGELPILLFQLPSPSPTTSSTATATPTISATTSITASGTATNPRTATSTTSSTASPSSMRTTSSSSSPSISASPTPTLSPTPTTTTSAAATTSMTASRTATNPRTTTSTTSSTASPSSMRTTSSSSSPSISTSPTPTLSPTPTSTTSSTASASSMRTTSSSSSPSISTSPTPTLSATASRTTTNSRMATSTTSSTVSPSSMRPTSSLSSPSVSPSASSFLSATSSPSAAISGSTSPDYTYSKSPKPTYTPSRTGSNTVSSDFAEVSSPSETPYASAINEGVPSAQSSATPQNRSSSGSNSGMHRRKRSMRIMTVNCHGEVKQKYKNRPKAHR